MWPIASSKHTVRSAQTAQSAEQSTESAERKAKRAQGARSEFNNVCSRSDISFTFRKLSDKHSKLIVKFATGAILKVADVKAYAHTEHRAQSTEHRAQSTEHGAQRRE